MTVFVTDIEDYRKSQALLAPVWRERLAALSRVALVRRHGARRAGGVVEIRRSRTSETSHDHIDKLPLPS